MANAAGETVSESRYRAYGERSDVQTATIRESKGWIGERDDPEVGLTYLNARYYDPVIARFIQPDWWDPTDPDVGTNRYAYGLNNPILSKDPSGHTAAIAAYGAGGFEFGFAASVMTGPIGVAAMAVAIALSPTPMGDGTLSARSFTDGDVVRGWKGAGSDDWGKKGAHIHVEGGPHVGLRGQDGDIVIGPSQKPDLDHKDLTGALDAVAKNLGTEKGRKKAIKEITRVIDNIKGLSPEVRAREKELKDLLDALNNPDAKIEKDRTQTMQDREKTDRGPGGSGDGSSGKGGDNSVRDGGNPNTD